MYHITSGISYCYYRVVFRRFRQAL